MRFKVDPNKYERFGYSIGRDYKWFGAHEWIKKTIYKHDDKLWEAKDEFDSEVVMDKVKEFIEADVEKSVELEYGTFAFEDINLTLVGGKGELFGQHFLFDQQFMVVRYCGKTYLAEEGIYNVVKAICEELFEEIEEYFNLEMMD